MALANATFPVYILCLSQRTPAIRRNEALDMELAVSLVKMHDGHDQDPLPLVEDYNDPNLQYRNPRSLRSWHRLHAGCFGCANMYLDLFKSSIISHDLFRTSRGRREMTCLVTPTFNPDTKEKETVVCID